MESQHSYERRFRLPRSQQSDMGFSTRSPRAQARPHPLVHLISIQIFWTRYQLLSNALCFNKSCRSIIWRFGPCCEIRCHRDATESTHNITRSLASYISNSGSHRNECTMQTLIANNTTLDLQRVTKCMRTVCQNDNGGMISSDLVGIGVRTSFRTKWTWHKPN